jgi:hypothetical protein
MKSGHKLIVIKKEFEEAFLEISNAGIGIIQGLPFWGPLATLMMVFWTYWHKVNHPIMNALSWWFDIAEFVLCLYLMLLNTIFISTAYKAVEFYFSTENCDNVKKIPFFIKSKPRHKLLAFVLVIFLIILSYELWRFWFIVYKFWIVKRGFLQNFDGIANFY